MLMNVQILAIADCALIVYVKADKERPHGFEVSNSL